MKNKILFIIGLILLIGIIWATTMLGIKESKKFQDDGETQAYTFIISQNKQNSCKNDIFML